MKVKTYTVKELDDRQYDLKDTLRTFGNALQQEGQIAESELMYAAIDLIEDLVDKMFELDEDLETTREELNRALEDDEPEDLTNSKGVIE